MSNDIGIVPLRMRLEAIIGGLTAQGAELGVRLEISEQERAGLEAQVSAQQQDIARLTAERDVLALKPQRRRK
jgi:hypothetical protein